MFTIEKLPHYFSDRPQMWELTGLMPEHVPWLKEQPEARLFPENSFEGCLSCKTGFSLVWPDRVVLEVLRRGLQEEFSTTSTNKAIKTQVAGIRNRYDLTQAELAGIVGVAAGTVSRWEAGKCDPDPLQAQLLDVLEGSEISKETLKKSLIHGNLYALYLILKLAFNPTDRSFVPEGEK